MSTTKLIKEKISAINETFTEEEFNELKAIKLSSGLNWHDFIIESAKDWDRIDRLDQPSRQGE